MSLNYDEHCNVFWYPKRKSRLGIPPSPAPLSPSRSHGWTRITSPREAFVLYHQTANGWVALPTTVIYTKDGMVYFSAQGPGFSLFAIAGTPAAAPPARVTPAPGMLNSPAQEQEQVQVAATRAPVIKQTTAPPATPTKPAAPSPLLNVVLVIAAIGILSGGGFIIRRWWIHW